MLGQSFTAIHGSTRTLQRCFTSRSLIGTSTISSTSPLSSCLGTQALPWVHSPARLCCPKACPTFSNSRKVQDNTESCFLSHHQGKLIPVKEFFCLWHSCSQHFNPFFSAKPPCPPLCHKLPLLSNLS